MSVAVEQTPSKRLWIRHGRVNRLPFRSRSSGGGAQLHLFSAAALELPDFCAHTRNSAPQFQCHCERRCPRVQQPHEFRDFFLGPWAREECTRHAFPLLEVSAPVPSNRGWSGRRAKIAPT